MTIAGAITSYVSEKWRYGLIGGVASIPFTMATYWQTGSNISLTPVFFGGLLAGYLAKRRLGKGHGVGARAGLIGGLPILWMLIDLLPFIVGLPNPTWFAIVSVLAALGTAVLGFGLAALCGEIGGRIGSWLSGRNGRERRSMPSHQ